MSTNPDTPENFFEPLVEVSVEDDDFESAPEVDLSALIGAFPPGPARQGVFVRALKYINAYTEDM